MATTTTTDPKAVEKWHHHYDDPRDDTVLITNDSVKFRVSSRLLCKHSDTFKSLFDPSHEQNIDVKPPIGGKDPFHLDIPELTLERFLTMLSPTTRELILAGLTFDQCRDLLTFTEQYRCQDLIPLIRSELIVKTVGPGKPIALFVYASGRDDWQLGQSALQAMDDTETSRITGSAPVPFGRHGSRAKVTTSEKVKDFIAQLRPEWQRSLIQGLFFASLDDHDALEGWRSCAEGFTKPDKSSKRPRFDVQSNVAKKA